MIPRDSCTGEMMKQAVFVSDPDWESRNLTEAERRLWVAELLTAVRKELQELGRVGVFFTATHNPKLLLDALGLEEGHQLMCVFQSARDIPHNLAQDIDTAFVLEHPSRVYPLASRTNDGNITLLIGKNNNGNYLRLGALVRIKS